MPVKRARSRFVLLLSFCLLVLLILPATVHGYTPPADLDGDSDVDLIDVKILLRQFGQTGNAPADLNQDGTVNVIDFNLSLSPYGKTFPDPTLKPSTTPAVSTTGLISSRQELVSHPTDSPGWNAIVSFANDSNFTTPIIADQDNKAGTKALAKALIYARTGDTQMRQAVANDIATMMDVADGQTSNALLYHDNAILALGRSLGAYVMAADLIDLKIFNPSLHNRFSNWLAIARNTVYGGHSSWNALVKTHELTGNNWGTFAGASRIAASLYLNDTTDVQRAATIFKAWLGQRSLYPSNAPGPNGYFQTTLGQDSGYTWSCLNSSSWVAVNPACTKSCSDININLDGVIFTDIVRGGACRWPLLPDDTGLMYSWEVLQGVFLQAELLYRHGYPDVYNWSNNALKRALDFMVRADSNGPGSVGKHVPWLAAARYGVAYQNTPGWSVDPAGYGRIFGFTDWLYHKR